MRHNNICHNYVVVLVKNFCIKKIIILAVTKNLELRYFCMHDFVLMHVRLRDRPTDINVNSVFIGTYT